MASLKQCKVQFCNPENMSRSKYDKTTKKKKKRKRKHLTKPLTWKKKDQIPVRSKLPFFPPTKGIKTVGPKNNDVAISACSPWEEGSRMFPANLWPFIF